MKLAYLNTLYPAVSHTFIEREIRALRALGVEIDTFSVQMPPSTEGLSAVHLAAMHDTSYLLRGPWRLFFKSLKCGLTRPLGLLRAFWHAQKLAPAGIGSRLRHLAYAAEAVILAAEMRRRKLRHVHVHMANNGAAVAALAVKCDPALSYSLSIHGSAEFFHVDSWRLKEKAEGALFVRCISQFCRAQVMAWTDPAVWPRLHMVHCGVDAAEFAPRPRRFQGPLRILTVGRLDPIKGYALLLEACRKLTDDGVDWSWDILGDGPLRRELERTAGELDIADRVRFHGFVAQDDIQRFYNDADVLVVSSFMEGVPVVLMEAMAKGLAVISTAVGGVPELVQAGKTGLLVPPGGVEPLYRALRLLAGDRALLGALGEPAQQKIAAEFSIQLCGRQMAELFARYVAGGAGAGLPARDGADARAEGEAVSLEVGK
jgi:colanic acid/amylovoran biosynthesis glycosyltransferase